MPHAHDLTVSAPATLHGQISGFSYTPSNTLSLDQWRNDVLLLAALADRSPWWLGDSLIEGEKRFGKTCYELLAGLPLERATLRQYRYVASRIPASMRNYAPSFSHAAAVASLP